MYPQIQSISSPVTCSFFLRGLILCTYGYIYEHHRLVDLPWDSVSTWVLAALGADFAYYWIHRAAHG